MTSYNKTFINVKKNVNINNRYNQVHYIQGGKGVSPLNQFKRWKLYYPDSTAQWNLDFSLNWVSVIFSGLRLYDGYDVKL